MNLAELYFIYVCRIYVDVDKKLMRQWKSTLTSLFHSFDQQLSKFLETMEERFPGEKSTIPTGCLTGTPIKNGATILFLVHQHCSCSLIVTHCYILITIKSSLAMISKWEITSSSPLGFRGLLFLLHPSWWYTQKHGETHRRLTS